MSLPLQSASRERISSSRTTERRRAARRSERVAERFGAITSFRFSKPACVKEHVCRPAIKYWWAPLPVLRYGLTRVSVPRKLDARFCASARAVDCRGIAPVRVAGAKTSRANPIDFSLSN